MWPMLWKKRADLLQSRRNGGKTGKTGTNEAVQAMTKRLAAVLASGLLVGCTSSAVTMPDTASVTEVPFDTAAPAASAGASASAAASSIGGVEIPEGMAVAPAGTTTAEAAPGVGRKLDDDKLNLLQTTLEEQKVDAAIAEKKLEQDRAQLVIVQPGALPDKVDGVNIALYAQQSTNPVGNRIYSRTGSLGIGSACSRFKNPDDAQRAFLAGGGPETDKYGLDPDGDGFACKWDPTPYRALKS